MMMREANFLLILVIAFAFSSCSFSANYTKLPMHKGTLKTIYNPNGEIVDCVDFYKQPAFDHPLLKDKKYKYTPEGHGFMRNMETKSFGPDASKFKIWRESKEECPNGTVPIVREADYNEDWVRKMKRFVGSNMSRSNSDGFKHEYAIVYLREGRYYGGRSITNLCKPRVAGDIEFSLVQMWLVNLQGSLLESIEAGWHGEIVGYWPASLFERLNDHANEVHWGGEIVDENEFGPHTSTQMGTGEFSSKGYGKAAYMHSLQVITEPDGAFVDVDAHALVPVMTNSNCYDLTVNPDESPFQNVNFFFGGAGYSHICK